MSIAEKLEIKLDAPAELTGTLAEKNHQLLTANKAMLAKVVATMKK